MRRDLAVAILGLAAGISPGEAAQLFNQPKQQPESPRNPTPHHLLGRRERIAQNYARQACEGLGKIPGRLKWARR